MDNIMNNERLYNLLPRVYRRKDIDNGYTLRALMAVLESEYNLLEEDIRALYDNWFIETCDEWAVPYIADLLDVRHLETSELFPFSLRALVADTLGYRRRKGTVAVVANAVRDATGWRTTAVEFFQRMAATQSMIHPRPGRGGTANLRNRKQLEQVGTPFDTCAHTADFHGFPAGGPSSELGRSVRRGGYNIADIGLYVWRLQSFPVFGAMARKVTGGFYTFNPFGIDQPLFNHPRTRDDTTRLAGMWNLPVPLTAGMLEENLRNHPMQPALRVWVKTVGAGEFHPIPSRHVRVCSPVSRQALQKVWADPAVRAAVDPQTGRLAFPPGTKPGKVKVDYCYGFSAHIGGGPYNRKPGWWDVEPLPWIANVAAGGRFGSISVALAAWKKAGGKGVIRITDNGAYNFSGTVELGPGEQLTIEAADGYCPVIIGDVVFAGTSTGNRVNLEGLWWDGTVTPSGRLTFILHHCTSAPRRESGIRRDVRPSLSAESGKCPALHVIVSHSITGPLRLPAETEGLEIRDSIIDGMGDYAVAAAPRAGQRAWGPPAMFQRVTLLGKVAVDRLLAASDTLFAAAVAARDPSDGFVRFSYLPGGSRTPVRYRCYSREDRAREGVRPLFTSLRFGDAGYAQLGPGCPEALRSGAENGAEIGAFNHLYQPQRETNLRIILEEYLPYGRNAGVFYIT